MTPSTFTITAWNNGEHSASGGGYGFKVPIADRDRYFDPTWSHIKFYLPGQADPILINVAKRSFWNSMCRELVHQEIGRWLQQQGLAPWSKGYPPKFTVEVLGEASFQLLASKVFS